MEITNYNQAAGLLNDRYMDASSREKAIHFLRDHPSREAIAELVDALDDDDFGVRWEASKALAAQGRDGLLALLSALTDPNRVGHYRFQQSAYRVLEHTVVPGVDLMIVDIMRALRGPAPDVVTMGAAFRLLQALQRNHVNQGRLAGSL